MAIFECAHAGGCSGIFTSLMSGVVVVATVWLAYKKNLEQLSRFIQLTCEALMFHTCI